MIAKLDERRQEGSHRSPSSPASAQYSYLGRSLNVAIVLGAA